MPPNGMKKKPYRERVKRPTEYHVVSKPESYFKLVGDPNDCYQLGGLFLTSQFYDTLANGGWAEGTVFEYRSRRYRVQGTDLINVGTGRPAPMAQRSKQVSRPLLEE